jgi:hypothetical protein
MNYITLGQFAIRLVDRGTVFRSPVAARDFLFSKLSSSALTHTHPASYSMGAGGFISEGKAAET